jgi:hypothetical protein
MIMSVPREKASRDDPLAFPAGSPTASLPRLKFATNFSVSTPGVMGYFTAVGVISPVSVNNKIVVLL